MGSQPHDRRCIITLIFLRRLYNYVGCACRRVVRSERSQWHERFCCDPEFMGLNPRWIEIGGLLFLC